MRRFLLVYFCFSFFCFTFLASGFVDSQDGLQYLAIARRIYFDHTFEMPEASFAQDANIYMNAQQSSNGKWYASTGLGYSLALIPAVMLEDLFLRIADLEPIQAFPLQNDWPVLLFASMTNAFFGALLVVTLYAYMRELKINHAWSVVLSFGAIISSNLITYAKHTFAQMFFVSFLTLTFYCVKKHSLTQNNWWLVAAGASFGLVVIAYNQTFVLAVPALALYYILLKQWKRRELLQQSLVQLKKMGNEIVAGLVGLLPFLILYLWFNAVRFGGSGVSVEATGSLPGLSSPPAFIVIEGIWSLLLSPGKSIFIFSPLLLVLVLFWFRLEKKIYPELLTWLVLFVVHLYMFGTLVISPNYPSWHGDASWGPRYMLPVLPLGLLIVATIVHRMKKIELAACVAPLFALGLGVAVLGIALPYQVRFFRLANSAELNGERFDVTLYGNIVPRYSPVFNMAKLAVQRLREAEQLYSYGPFNFRLHDGFEREFLVGNAVWREPMREAVILFDNPSNHPVDALEFQLRNHQIDLESSSSAELRFELNGELLQPDRLELAIGEEQRIQLEIPEQLLFAKNNRLLIFKKFLDDPSASYTKKQVVFLQIANINGIQQSISTLSYPYVSQVSQKLFNAEYQYFGKIETNPWKIWHLHSAVYEGTFDFWWLRPFYYWDFPKSFFAGLFGFNSVLTGYFGYLMIRFSPKK